MQFFPIIKNLKVYMKHLKKIYIFKKSLTLCPFEKEKNGNNL